MASTAVAFLLENVTQLLEYSHKANLISGDARKELQKLMDQLKILKNFIPVTTQEQLKESNLSRSMERDMKEFVYDVEDTIDSCLAQAVAAKGKCFLWRGFKRNHPSLAEQMKSLREDMVKPIIERVKMDFANIQIEGEPADWTQWKKVPLIREDNVVGFKDEEEIIIKYLTEEREELDVISIIGMPGIGKTTLARKIFRNPYIRSEFPNPIWVYVSHEPNVRDIFLNIVKGFTSEDMSSLTVAELARYVRSFLESGKFLLVMDEVWNIEDWNAIKSLLPKNNRLCKVLITTRDWRVAKQASINREPYMLRLLNVEESWVLFQLEAFGKLNSCPQELEEIGKCIAAQCGGLPYAVITIAGTLLHRTTRANMKQTWMKVSHAMGSYVKEWTSGILTRSLEEVPQELRNCFLYLGVFPQDYEIPVWTLTRLWVAEGFVPRKEGQSLEETAEEILTIFINRNLLLVGKTNLNGQVKTCHVDEMIREFCISKAGIEDQNLFQEIKMSKEKAFEPPVSVMQKCRRLCIHSHLRDLLSERIEGKRVRSFSCFSKEPMILPQEYISAFPDFFHLLRVLDSKSFKFSQFPQKITKLIHLRYITLSCDDLKVLPEEVSELWNLQTLVVDTKSRTLEIRGRIGKMIQLRHLRTKAAFILAKQGDRVGENLQMMSSLSPQCCTEEVFRSGSNLKKLGIRGHLARLVDAKSLKALHCLENLKLVNDPFPESASENPQPSLLPLNCLPPNIKKLTLSSTFLNWKHISMLAMIGTLEVLKLKDNAYRGEVWPAVDGGFRRLEYLLIESTFLVVIKASAHHFPSLSYLVLKNCKNLQRYPPNLDKFLQKWDTEGVSKSSSECASRSKTLSPWSLVWSCN